MVNMTIFGLALDETNKAPILVLKGEDETSVLPIWIGAMEAMAISMALNKVDFPRPMTHDLLLNVIAQLDSKLVRIEVTDIEKGMFFAELVVETEKGVKRIDSRPSDAIALAVRAECPILVADKVVSEASTPYQEDAETVIKTEDADKWMDELDKLSEDDAKYKM